MIAIGLVAALMASDPAVDGTVGVATFVPGYTTTKWAVAPGPADLARVKPKSPARGVAGFSCFAAKDDGLSNCAPIGEEPRNAGFSAASTHLLPKFKLKPEDGRAARRDLKQVQVWIAYGGSEGCYPPYCNAVPPPPAR